MAVPYTFGTATAAIPLSQLDSNFATAITIGNTAVQLGNTVTTLNNMTLANVTISSGTVTITNVAVTTANVSGTANISTLVVVGNETVGGNTTITGNITAANANVTTNLVLSGGTANGVAYLNGSKVVTTGSALTFDGTTLGTNNALVRNGVLTIGTDTLYDAFVNTPESMYFNVDSDGNSTGNSFIWGTDRAGTTGGTEFMRISGATGGVGAVGIGYSSLTSVGNNGLAVLGNVGIGTSSPTKKLDVRVTGTGNVGNFQSDNGPNVSFTGTETNGRTYQIGEGLVTAGSFSIYDTTGSAERLVINSSGNLGLGVTPSAWFSSNKTMQVGSTGALSNYTNGSNIQTFLSNNVYWNAAGTISYLTTNTATSYTQDNGTHKFYVAPSGTAGNAISFTQAMTLDASGNLGIGATDPQNKLQVVTTTRPQFSVSYNGTTGLYLEDGTNSSWKSWKLSTSFGNGSDLSFVQSTNTSGTPTWAATAAMTLDASGNLLVGKTTVSTTSGTGWVALATGLVSVVAPSTLADTYNYYNSTAGAYRFYVTKDGVINATSTTITGISDQRLKENIRDLDDGLSAIMALQPRKFDWKEGKGADIKNARGFIAQEFETVFPDLIDEWKDPAPEGEEPYKSVRADLIPVLVKAIQELKAEFDAYKASHP